MGEPLYSEDALRFYLRQDEEDFRSKYGLDADECPDHVQSECDWARFKELDSVAQQLVRWADQLGGTDRDRLEEAIEGLKEETFLRSAFEHGAIAMGDEEQVLFFHFTESGELKEADPIYELSAWEFIQQLMNYRLTERELERATAMTKRMKKLLGFLTDAKGERTRAYLNRVSRCYLLGLETEGTIMCRSVLEAAVERVTSDEEVFDADLSQTRNPTLAERLTYLQDKRGLSRLASKAARFVREAGNDAVHAVPGTTDLKRVVKLGGGS